MDIYAFDDSFRKDGVRHIAGIDEAGRGPLAGPVVSSAVILPEDARIDGLRDSKKVPEKERTYLFREILAASMSIGVGIVGHEEIDRLNILRCTKMAMETAVKDLSFIPDMLIIDAVKLPAISIKQLSVVRADAKSASVAAASIVAKYIRDKAMERYHHLYPAYNFIKHKGYGTREHINLIRKFGPCPIHRKSFHQVMTQELPL